MEEQEGSKTGMEEEEMKKNVSDAEETKTKNEEQQNSESEKKIDKPRESTAKLNGERRSQTKINGERTSQTEINEENDSKSKVDEEGGSKTKINEGGGSQTKINEGRGSKIKVEGERVSKIKIEGERISKIKLDEQQKPSEDEKELAELVAQEGEAYDELVHEQELEEDRGDLSRTESMIESERHSPRLSVLTEQLQDVINYQEFEQALKKKKSLRESWDFWDSPTASETDFPMREADRPQVKAAMTPAQFQEAFGNVAQLPSLSQLSVTTTIERIPERQPSPEAISLATEKPADVGRFVDPLTGESLHSLDLEVPAPSIAVTEASSSSSSITSEESDIILDVSEDEEILKLINQMDERDRALVQPVEQAEDLVEKEMAAFFDEIANAPEEEPEIRLSEILKQLRAEEKTKNLIIEFLDSLIGRVAHDVCLMILF